MSMNRGLSHKLSLEDIKLLVDSGRITWDQLAESDKKRLTKAEHNLDSNNTKSSKQSRDVHINKSAQVINLVTEGVRRILVEEMKTANKNEWELMNNTNQKRLIEEEFKKKFGTDIMQFKIMLLSKYIG